MSRSVTVRAIGIAALAVAAGRHLIRARAEQFTDLCHKCAPGFSLRVAAALLGGSPALHDPHPEIVPDVLVSRR